MRRKVRLTESDLHRIVRESVKRVINEVGDTNVGQNLLGQLNMRKRLGRHKDQASEVDDYARSQWSFDDDGIPSIHDTKPDNYWKGQDNYKKYQKGRNIIKALKQLNFEKRGHEINNYMHEYPAEISVTNMNVPAESDCKEIARKFGVHFYTESSFNIGIFELD